MEEGDTRRETQVVGGPLGVSRQRTTTFVVVRFLPSFLPSFQLTNSPSNSSVANHVRMRRSQRRLRSNNATWETPPQRPGEGTAARSRDSHKANDMREWETHQQRQTRGNGGPNADLKRDNDGYWSRATWLCFSLLLYFRLYLMCLCTNSRKAEPFFGNINIYTLITAKRRRFREIIRLS